MPAQARYPIFMDLWGLPVLVVGGGAVGARKARALLSCGAHVAAVAPKFGAALAMASHPRLRRIRRRFRPADVRGRWLVIAATDDAAVNRRVFQAAERRRIPCNVVDDPASSRFIAPAVLRRGPIRIAVSTGGTCPALARQLRRKLERTFGEEYGRFARLLAGLRKRAMRRFADPALRARLLEAASSSRVFRLFERKGKQAAEECLRVLFCRFRLMDRRMGNNRKSRIGNWK